MVFRQRQVNPSGIASVKRRSTCVADNANDLVGGPGSQEFTAIVELLVGGAQTERAADGVLARPEQFGG